jgi:magnesium and cobalt exporter, CNNM family
MDQQLILLIVLLLLSGFFSGTELAFVVANKLKIEIRSRKNNPAAKAAHYLVENPQTFFSTILIGNSVVNITLASLSAIFLARIFGFGEFTIILISSLVILLFGEILPKYFARELADRIVLWTSIPLRIIAYVLYPIVKAASSLSEKITSTKSASAENIGHLFDKEDIKILVKESEKAGVVDKKASDLITRVFELSEQRVHEAMTPRTEIVGIEINQSIDEAIEILIESGFSKLAVYENDLDNIKGILLAKDVFNNPTSVQNITREVSFIPESKKSFEALNEFLEKRISIAIIVDEFGGTAGIITMEDILEELFGEIKDEFDIEEEICRKIGERTYIISGKVEIDHINEKYDLRIEEGDYETLSGYILNKTGRIPRQGETVKIDNFTILIARASAQKVEMVKLIQNPE